MSSSQPNAPFLPVNFVLPPNGESRDYLIQKREADTAIFLNQRDISNYYPTEIINGQQWYMSSPPVQAFRKVINFGALPNATTKTVAHGITFNINSVVTRLYGGATSPSAPPYSASSQLFIPLPFAHPTSSNCIALKADGTNIYVITGIDYSAYTTCYIVIEYLKG